MRFTTPVTGSVYMDLAGAPVLKRHVKGMLAVNFGASGSPHPAQKMLNAHSLPLCDVADIVL